MMLRRRFKQSLASDHHHHHPHLLSPLPSSSSSSSIHFHSSPSSTPPRFFSDSDPAMMSPTSVLESKPFSSCTAAAGLFAGEKRPARSLSIGLGIADALAGGEEGGSSTAAVLFGSKLRVRDHLPVDPPRSPPIEFGIKTRDSQLGLLEASASPPPVFARSLSAKEMEMSEEYTCVISHGPNPRTTHIFDGCVVESCSGGEFSIAGKDHGHLPSSCDSCGKENFSHERRRNEEMMFDEKVSD